MAFVTEASEATRFLFYQRIQGELVSMGCTAINSEAKGQQQPCSMAIRDGTAAGSAFKDKVGQSAMRGSSQLSCSK